MNMVAWMSYGWNKSIHHRRIFQTAVQVQSGQKELDICTVLKLEKPDCTTHSIITISAAQLHAQLGATERNTDMKLLIAWKPQLPLEISGSYSRLMRRFSGKTQPALSTLWPHWPPYMRMQIKAQKMGRTFQSATQSFFYPVYLCNINRQSRTIGNLYWASRRIKKHLTCSDNENRQTPAH